jgi:hypothetical protein
MGLINQIPTVWKKGDCPLFLYVLKYNGKRNAFNVRKNIETAGF